MVTEVIHQVQAIRLLDISPDPDQPRKHFDPDDLQELANSIRESGLLQPITIRPDGDGAYMLIAGERRYRACRSLEWETIPAIVRDDLSDKETVLLQLLENTARQDLNPIEEAKAYRKMVDEGFTVEEIAKASGKKVTHIEFWMTFLSAIPEVQELTAKGVIAPTTCAWIGRLNYDNQRKMLAVAANRKVSVMRLNEMCWHLGNKEAEMPMFMTGMLTEAEVKTAADFNKVFPAIGSGVNRLLAMEEEKPGSMYAALKSNLPLIRAQIGETIRGLRKLENELDKYWQLEQNQLLD